MTIILSTLSGQILYGRVLWNPEQNLNAAYKLQLEKVYLCTGKDGYVPFFDPTGTIYNEGPQYGCIQPNKYLKHRFLLLVGCILDKIVTRNCGSCGVVGSYVRADSGTISLLNRVRICDRNTLYF